MPNPLALPVNIDTTYADSGTDASVKLHQQYHDRVHSSLNNQAEYNVKDYGAVGDGTTNDAAAIQDAINAAPTDSGVVVFPPGKYVCNSPLIPKRGIIFRGTHTPYYWGGDTTLYSNCKIMVGPAWTGTDGQGLIQANNTGGGEIKGVSFENLALSGEHRAASGGGVVHGVRFASADKYNGEMSWRFRDCAIGHFSGSGAFGMFHVGTWNNCYIQNNDRMGFETSGSDRWNDQKILNCYFFYNKLGGAVFAGGVTTAGSRAGSGFLTFTNCRFERSGQVQGFPTNTPTQAGWNADAPGIRFVRAQNVNLTSCTTDANTGVGFDVLGEVGGWTSAMLNNITLTGCFANRDGGGAQTTLGTTDSSSGYRVKGVSATGTDEPAEIHFVGCDTSTGGSSDTGGSTVISPAYGASFENCQNVDWIVGRATGQSGTNMRFGPTDSTWASVFIWNEAGRLVHRNRLGITAEIASGLTSHTMWASDAIAAQAGQGAAGFPVAVTEFDTTFQGSRWTVDTNDLGIMCQIFVMGRVLTALNGATLNITVRDTSNTGNLLVNTALTQSLATQNTNFGTGAVGLVSPWVMRPAWLTGTKTLAVCMQITGSTATTSTWVIREVSVRFKGGGA